MAGIERGKSPFDGLEPEEVSAWLANPVTMRLMGIVKHRIDDQKEFIVNCCRTPGILPGDSAVGILIANESLANDFTEAERYARGV